MRRIKVHITNIIVLLLMTISFPAQAYLGPGMGGGHRSSARDFGFHSHDGLWAYLLSHKKVVET